MRLILLGPPGSGKGTQAVGLAAQLQVPHIATGDLFRSEMASDSELGKLAKRYISRGNLVPDDVVNAMMHDRLGRADAVGFVLDGYPRTQEQAEALDQTLQELGRPLDIALELKVPDEVIVDRAVGRLVCPNCDAIYHLQSKPPRTAGICDLCRGVLVVRDDDQPSTVRHRLAVYHRLTAPVLRFYQERGLLRAIDGVGPRETIAARLQEQLDLVRKVVSSDAE